MQRWNATPSYRAAPGPGSHIDETRYVWMPPLSPVMPHDWFGGYYESNDRRVALHVFFSGQGQPGMEFLDLVHPPRAQGASAVAMRAELMERRGATAMQRIMGEGYDLKVQLQATFIDPGTGDRQVVVFDLVDPGTLIEREGTQGPRRAWRKLTQAE